MGCSQMFSFDKAQRVSPPVPLLFTIRVLAKRPTALQMCRQKRVSTANRPRPTERRKECVSPSLKTEPEQTDKLTHARTFTTTYIHTHEPNIWLLMLNQGS